MNIFIADTTLHHQESGGAQLFLPGLVTGLVTRSHSVSLVCDGLPGPRLTNLLADTGVTIHNLYQRCRLPQDKANKLAKYINRIRPDIFVVSVSADIAWLVLPLLDPGIATLCIGHTDSRTFYEPARHYRAFLTMGIGVSETVCKEFRDRSDLDASSINWIPYGVLSSKNPPEPKDGARLELIYVGRLDEEQKRVSDIVQIIKGLSVTDCHFHFTIVGDGPERPRMEALLSNEVNTGSVTFTGWVPPHEVISYMQQAEIFLLASAYEGFCISLTEAMANGCCPIVTDIRSGNHQLVVNSENGYIVPLGDIARFIETITLLQKDPIRLFKLRMAAWERGRSFNEERMINAYCDTFRQAVVKAFETPRMSNPQYPVMESCKSNIPNWLRRLKVGLLIR